MLIYPKSVLRLCKPHPLVHLPRATPRLLTLYKKTSIDLSIVCLFLGYRSGRTCPCDPNPKCVYINPSGNRPCLLLLPRCNPAALFHFHDVLKFKEVSLHTLVYLTLTRIALRTLLSLSTLNVAHNRKKSFTGSFGLYSHIYFVRNFFFFILCICYFSHISPLLATHVKSRRLNRHTPPGIHLFDHAHLVSRGRIRARFAIFWTCQLVTIVRSSCSFAPVAEIVLPYRGDVYLVQTNIGSSTSSRNSITYLSCSRPARLWPRTPYV